MKRKPVVFLGMSGGVDSSVSALLLKQAGYEVVGVFINTWHPDFIVCNEAEERRDAMRAATFLDIPFLVFDFEKEYKEGVADYMIEEYKKGRTPNPDVMCNKEVKFGAFMEKALSMGADFVATGHYARSATRNASKKVLGFPSHRYGDARPDHFYKHSASQLVKGIDPTKDQSYFLWTLTSKQLDKIIFPIGHLKKTEVRKIAKKYKLPVADKKDSQGICFLGEVDLKDFLKHYIKEKKGLVLNEKGEEVGEHEGVFYFTLGERHGFTIHKKSPNDKPYYVYKKDIKKNILYVSQNKNYMDSVKEEDLHLKILKNINFPHVPEIEKWYDAQIRYHGELLKCKLLKLANTTCQIYFEKPVSVSEGQSVVLYRGEVCLGGGIVV